MKLTCQTSFLEVGLSLYSHDTVMIPRWEGFMLGSVMWLAYD